MLEAFDTCAFSGATASGGWCHYHIEGVELPYPLLSFSSKDQSMKTCWSSNRAPRGLRYFVWFGRRREGIRLMLISWTRIVLRFFPTFRWSYWQTASVGWEVISGGIWGGRGEREWACGTQRCIDGDIIHYVNRSCAVHEINAPCGPVAFPPPWRHSKTSLASAALLSRGNRQNPLGLSNTIPNQTRFNPAFIADPMYFR